MEDFVNFEIAKKLKEKGFKEQCLAYYTKDSGFYYNTSYGSDVENAFKSFNSRPNHICGKRIDAPIIYQVLKWLRDTHKLYVCPCVIADYQDDFHRDTTYWSFIVVNIESGDSIYREYERVTEKRYESYEQAALASIEYVLDNLI